MATEAYVIYPPQPLQLGPSSPSLPLRMNEFSGTYFFFMEKLSTESADAGKQVVGRLGRLRWDMGRIVSVEKMCDQGGGGMDDSAVFFQTNPASREAPFSERGTNGGIGLHYVESGAEV